MLLKRKTVVDQKTGNVEDAVVLRVCGSDGHPKNVTLTGRHAARFNQIDASLRGYGGLFQPSRKGAFDATDPLVWNISELAYVEAKMAKRLRAPTFYKKLLPLSFEAPPWATTIDTQIYDEIGIAEIAASDSTDMPFADVRFDRVTLQVTGGKIGYHYDVQELLESAHAKKPLSELRQAAAYNAYDRFLNMVAMRGDTRLGQKGLWNQSGVTPVAATTGSWDLPATDVLGIINDFIKPINAIYENTGGNVFCTTIAMPLKLLSILGSRILTVTTGGVTLATPMTVLEYIKANNVSKLVGDIDIEFIGLPDDIKADGTVNTAANTSLSYAGTLKHNGNTGAAQSSRVVFYANDPERLVMHIPLPLNFLAPQPRNTDIVIPGRFRFTAPKLLFPKSMYYLDNVHSTDTAS
jgi:hypothetical protein